MGKNWQYLLCEKLGNGPFSNDDVYSPEEPPDGEEPSAH